MQKNYHNTLLVRSVCGKDVLKKTVVQGYVTKMNVQFIKKKAPVTKATGANEILSAFFRRDYNNLKPTYIESAICYTFTS